MSAPLFVAEIGANHGGSFARACELVRSAAEAGADMVKLQCWSPGTMAGNKSVAIEHGPWAGRTLHDLYAECFTPWKWFDRLKEEAERNGIELFASAFDLPAVAFLEELGVYRHKVASFELVDDELVRACAMTGKPLILSTGMATLDEVRHAITEAEDMGARDITLLKCVSAYPARASDANLGAMRYLDAATDHKVGLSDHTMGNAVSIAAAATGARMIERHFTLSRNLGGPDAAFSLEPPEFRDMVNSCIAAAAACRGSDFGPSKAEESHLPLRRSLWWARDMAAGTRILRTDIRSARPANGLPCGRLGEVVGAFTAVAVEAGQPIEEGEFT